jgi:hypothetical protein
MTQAQHVVHRGRIDQTMTFGPEGVRAGTEEPWAAWQARSIERKRATRRRLATACLFGGAVLAIASAFWLSFGGAL